MKAKIEGYEIECSPAEFRELISKTTKTVETKVLGAPVILGKRKNKTWTMEEKIFMEQNREKKAKWLANKLHRTVGAIYQYRTDMKKRAGR